jgi:hypothetical protein
MEEEPTDVSSTVRTCTKFFSVLYVVSFVIVWLVVKIMACHIHSIDIYLVIFYVKTYQTCY